MSRHRARRIALWTLAALTTVVGATAAFAWWVVDSEPGAEWGFERLGAILPGKLKVGDMDGPIRGPLVVENVSYVTDHWEVTIDRLELDWQLRELVHNRLDIHKLHARGVDVVFHTRDAAPDTTPLPDVDLRVAILVRQALVENMRVRRAGIDADSALFIDRISVDAVTLRDTLNVHQIAVRSQLFDADLDGTLVPRGDYPLDLRVTWRYLSPAGQQIRGGGTIHGSLDRLVVDQRVREPFTGHAVLRDYDPIVKGTFDGRVAFENLSPRALSGTGPEGAWTGDATIAGRFEEFTARGSASGTVPQLGRVRAGGTVRRDGTFWTLDRVEARRPGHPGFVIARGTLETRGEPEFRGDLEWRNLQVPHRPEWRSDRGHARVEGTLAGYRVNGTARVQGPGLDVSNWSLRGRGDQSHLQIDQVQGGLLDGSVTARGRVDWRTGVRWNLVGSARDLDPAAAWPQFPGRIAAELQTEGTVAGSGPRGTARLVRASGTLRERPLEATAALRFSGGRYDLDSLNVRVEDARLTASGQVVDPWNLKWNLDAPNLGALVPTGAGRLAASGSVVGSGRAPRLQAHVTGDTLAVRNTYVAGLVADFDIGAGPSNPVDIDLAARHITSGSRYADSLTVTGRGIASRHTVDVAIVTPVRNWHAAFAGGLDGRRWQGDLNALDLRSERFGNWSLDAPAPLMVDGTALAVDLGSLCWRSGVSSVCAEGAWSRAAGWNARAVLDSLQLALLEGFVVRDLQLTGNVNGTLDARADATGVVTASMRLEPGPGTIHFPTGATDSVAFSRGVIAAAVDGSGLSGEMAFTFATRDSVRASFGLPGYRRLAMPGRGQAVQGRLVADMQDLGVVQALLPQLADPTGRLNADLTVGGSLGNARLTGNIDLQNARAKVPELGIELTEITLRARGAGGRDLTVEGSMRSGDGTVTWNGGATLGDSATIDAKLSIDGNRFLAMDTSDNRVVVSPDLDLAMKGEKVQVDGQVTVPTADLEFKQREPIVRPSPDVRVIGERGDTTLADPGYDVTSRVRVVFGDDVMFVGEGLRGKITGRLLVLQSPGEPVRASGTVALEEGTYEAYGQEFAIDRGNLVYAGGAITDPGLDLRVSRTAQNGVIAGFEVRGTLDRPVMTVFSEPAMEQEQALAYAITGRPLEEVSQFESELLADYASAYALQEGTEVAGDLAESVGIEEARLESRNGSFDETALFLGKYIGSKLQLSYGVGLFQSMNVVRLRYLLNRRWTIEAETADENRASVLFTTEP